MARKPPIDEQVAQGLLQLLGRAGQSMSQVREWDYGGAPGEVPEEAREPQSEKESEKQSEPARREVPADSAGEAEGDSASRRLYALLEQAARGKVAGQRSAGPHAARPKPAGPQPGGRQPARPQPAGAQPAGAQPAKPRSAVPQGAEPQPVRGLTMPRSAREPAMPERRRDAREPAMPERRRDARTTISGRQLPRDLWRRSMAEDDAPLAIRWLEARIEAARKDGD